MMIRGLLFAALIVASQPGRAQDEICTDRPSKADAPCTVSKGHFQFEADTLDWQASRSADTRTDRIATNPVLKYGVGGATDIEVGWSPQIYARTRTGAVATDDRGVGDVTLRIKQRLTRADAGF